MIEVTKEFVGCNILTDCEDCIYSYEKHGRLMCSFREKERRKGTDR